MGMPYSMFSKWVSPKCAIYFRNSKEGCIALFVTVNKTGYKAISSQQYIICGGSFCKCVDRWGFVEISVHNSKGLNGMFKDVLEKTDSEQAKDCYNDRK